MCMNLKAPYRTFGFHFIQHYKVLILSFGILQFVIEKCRFRLPDSIYFNNISPLIHQLLLKAPMSLGKIEKGKDWKEEGGGGDHYRFDNHYKVISSHMFRYMDNYADRTK